VKITRLLLVNGLVYFQTEPMFSLPANKFSHVAFVKF